jgi:hypothetical protein
VGNITHLEFRPLILKLELEVGMFSVRSKLETIFCGAMIVFGLGCTKTVSSNIKTSGLYASYQLVGNNQNSVSCSVSFQVGGFTGTYVSLEDGDQVTCDGNSMIKSELFGIITYSATVSFRPSGSYEITLTRPGESAYTSNVTLPTVISGYSPSTSTTITKGNAQSVSWNASANTLESMDVTLSYSVASQSYSYRQNDTYPENGTLGFSSSETQVNSTVSGTWAGQLKFSRYLDGVMADSLDGYIKAKQEVIVSVSLVD